MEGDSASNTPGVSKAQLRTHFAEHEDDALDIEDVYGWLVALGRLDG